MSSVLILGSAPHNIELAIKAEALKAGFAAQGLAVTPGWEKAPVTSTFRGASDYRTRQIDLQWTVSRIPERSLSRVQVRQAAGIILMARYEFPAVLKERQAFETTIREASELPDDLAQLLTSFAAHDPTDDSHYGLRVDEIRSHLSWLDAQLQEAKRANVPIIIVPVNEHYMTPEEIQESMSLSAPGKSLDGSASALQWNVRVLSDTLPAPPANEKLNGPSLLVRGSEAQNVLPPSINVEFKDWLAGLKSPSQPQATGIRTLIGKLLPAAGTSAAGTGIDGSVPPAPVTYATTGFTLDRIKQGISSLF